MSAIKVFQSGTHHNLGVDINAWLAQTDGQITITGLTAGLNQYGQCVTVVYDRRPGPQYLALTGFHRRHDHLEEEVNRTLAEEPIGHIAFAAQGSAEVGHFICLLGSKGEVRSTCQA